eukprot:TRINITY_DN55844_c0_g1_i1.p2 TRINITY_DN55844_c0_g1~~TRINITY_DN55844_c0_g1_i1.p2  ORF type:complete len:138 (+),score=30.28 TRINITY_DN55844_c0_g1_i1:86-499(+)
MKLLTHNLLQCNKKGVTNGFPLIIRPTHIKYEESPYDKDFVSAMIPKLEWEALLKATRDLRDSECASRVEGLPAGGLPALPATISDSDASNETFLKSLHTVLFDVHVMEGTLVCPQSGREFPVEKGIPNMLLNDDEV